MSDNATKTISAVFETREAADYAIEHLVQQHGLNRADIFAEPQGDQNTAGNRVSGGDANKGDMPSQPALQGGIKVSVDAAQDPESAALMGVNSTKVVQVTFLIGGLMAGVAATLYMMKIGSTRQNAGFLLGVKAFTAAVMGGIGNLRGALLGGLLLGIIENWGAAVAGNQWRDVVAFVLLVLILLVRPSGLLGEALGKARA